MKTKGIRLTKDVLDAALAGGTILGGGGGGDPKKGRKYAEIAVDYTDLRLITIDELDENDEEIIRMIHKNDLDVDCFVDQKVIVLLNKTDLQICVEKEELVMAMEAAGEVESLHRPVGMKDGNEVMLLEKIADTGGAEEKILDHLLLTELIKELKKDERKLLYLRYFADKTQTEIGEELGISQVQVSRMEKKILKTMREHAKE